MMIIMKVDTTLHLITTPAEAMTQATTTQEVITTPVITILEDIMMSLIITLAEAMTLVITIPEATTILVTITPAVIIMRMIITPAVTTIHQTIIPTVTMAVIARVITSHIIMQVAVEATVAEVADSILITAQEAATPAPKLQPTLKIAMTLTSTTQLILILVVVIITATQAILS